MASLTGAGWQGPGVPFGVLEVFTSGFLVLTGMPWGCLPRSHGTRETLERLWVQLPVGGWEESGVHLFPKPGVSAVFGAEKWGPWGGESALDSAREHTWERMVAERRRMAAWPPNNGLEAPHLDRNVLDVAQTQSYKNMTCVHRHRMVPSLASDLIHS